MQIACDHAKNATARLTGQEPPRFEDDEQTIDDLKGRIVKTIEYVQSARPTAFEGAEDQPILFPLIENLVFDSNGFEYLRDWALPHFYFHVVTAYDILRHNGVEIGKRDLSEPYRRARPPARLRISIDQLMAFRLESMGG